MDDNLKTVATNSLLNIIRYAGLIIVSLVTSIILARRLGPDGRGIYAVVISVASLAVSMTNTGINSAIVYYVARRQMSLSDMIQRSFGLSIIVSIFATAFAALTLVFSWILYPGISINFLLIGITMIPIIIFTNNFASIFAGIEDFASNNILQLSTQFATLLLTIILVALLPLGILGGILSIVIGNLSGLIAAVILIHRQTEVKQLSPIFDWQYIREVSVYGLKTQIGYLATILNYRADIFILNWFTGTAFVGIYTQAVQIGEQMWLLSRALASAVLPRISALEGFDNERSKITSIMARYLLWINIAASVTLYIIAEPAIVLLYGEEFRASATALKFLLPGLVAVGTSRIISSDIAGRGKPELNGLHSFIAAIINIVLNIILIPRYGFIGSAIATTISYTTLYVLKLSAFRHLTTTPIHKLIALYTEDILRVYRFSRNSLTVVYRRYANK